MSIYFLRFGDLVKIGYSSSLATRVQAIITGIPGDVQFVGHMPGERDVEAHFHEVFGASRFNGEWFLSTPRLEALMASALNHSMPAIDKAITSGKRRLDANDAWATAGDRVRDFAARRWPTLNHRDRLVALTKELGWRPRRVRSLYQRDPGLTLRTVEAEDLDALMSSTTTNPPTGAER